jgi:hypothetical protein
LLTCFAHCSRQSWQNVGIAPLAGGENSGMPAAIVCVRYPIQSSAQSATHEMRARAGAVCSVHVEHPTAFRAGKSRPEIFGFFPPSRLTGGRCLYEIVNQARRVVPWRHIPVDTGDFVPPVRGIFPAHHCLPTTHERRSLYAQPRRDYVRGALIRGVSSVRGASPPRLRATAKPVKFGPPTA